MGEDYNGVVGLWCRAVGAVQVREVIHLRTLTMAFLIALVAMLAASCSFSDFAQDAGDAVTDAADNSDEPIPSTVGTIVQTTTGIPYSGAAAAFLTSLVFGLFQKKKRTEVEKAATVMADAIEASPDKAAIAAKVKEKSTLEGVLEIVHTIVKSLK